jgi:uncharacterized membrane protein YhaH (DUF805 family)
MEQFNNYFIDVIKSKYAQFSGRAPRREYWYFLLFSIIIGFVLGIVDAVAGTMLTLGTDPMGQPILMGMLGMIFNLALLIPSIAIGIRRLHDTGKSGWWLLIGFIPILGALVLLFFFVTPSQEGDNDYGSYPTN